MKFPVSRVKITEEKENLEKMAVHHDVPLPFDSSMNEDSQKNRSAGVQKKYIESSLLPGIEPFG